MTDPNVHLNPSRALQGLVLAKLVLAKLITNSLNCCPGPMLSGDVCRGPEKCQ